jgi:hypothetical protein
MGTYKITKKERKQIFDTFKEMLARYKFDWNALRTVMVATGAVISGSTALAVLLGGEFVPQDLDIYVNDKGFDAILVFLINHGYQVVKARPYNALEKKYPESKTILTLKRDGEKIDLIRTTEDHILATVTQFHSTVVMNYITFYGIFCLYPEWTMRRKALVTRRNVSCKILDKYQIRGFKIGYTSSELSKHDVSHNCGKDICCPTTTRNLRDGFTLFIPFDDKATDFRDLEDNDKLGWALREVRNCKKTEK